MSYNVLIVMQIIFYFLIFVLFVSCVFYFIFLSILILINKVNYILSMMRHDVFFKFFFSTISTLITPYHLLN